MRKLFILISLLAAGITVSQAYASAMRKEKTNHKSVRQVIYPHTSHVTFR